MAVLEPSASDALPSGLLSSDRLGDVSPQPRAPTTAIVDTNSAVRFFIEESFLSKNLAHRKPAKSGADPGSTCVTDGRIGSCSRGHTRPKGCLLSVPRCVTLRYSRR
jgi:hypothetical protein